MLMVLVVFVGDFCPSISGVGCVGWWSVFGDVFLGDKNQFGKFCRLSADWP
jgi:hypothetical protein